MGCPVCHWCTYVVLAAMAQGAARLCRFPGGWGCRGSASGHACAWRVWRRQIVPAGRHCAVGAACGTTLCRGRRRRQGARSVVDQRGRYADRRAAPGWIWHSVSAPRNTHTHTRTHTHTHTLTRTSSPLKHQLLLLLQPLPPHVTVDRVLLALQALGVTSFARVGSLRRIAKPLLPHVANGRRGEGVSVAPSHHHHHLARRARDRSATV
jgi:hypothetical protein